MEDCNLNWTPDAKTPLIKDEDSFDMTEAWNYRSISGMMLYLVINTHLLTLLVCMELETLMIPSVLSLELDAYSPLEVAICFVSPSCTLTLPSAQVKLSSMP